MKTLIDFKLTERPSGMTRTKTMWACKLTFSDGSEDVFNGATRVIAERRALDFTRANPAVDTCTLR